MPQDRVAAARGRVYQPVRQRRIAFPSGQDRIGSEVGKGELTRIREPPHRIERLCVCPLGHLQPGDQSQRLGIRRIQFQRGLQAHARLLDLPLPQILGGFRRKLSALPPLQPF